MSRTLSRREVLSRMGITAGLLPLLDAVPAFGAGPSTGYPKRLIILVWTNGTIENQFWPQGTGSDLSALKLPAITASLAPYVQDLLFINGLDIRNAADAGIKTFGHQTYSTMFTGTRGTPFNAQGEPGAKATSPSIDQVIADGVAKQVTLPVRSLALGAMRGGNAFYNCCFYRGAGLPVAAEQSPENAAGQLFTNAKISPTFIQLRAERKSLLDYSAGDLGSFGKTLGTEDRKRVAAHLDAVRELEKRTTRLADGACAGPMVTDLPKAAENYPAYVSSHMDIIVNAFKCDLTRVATLQMSDFNGDRITFPWLGDLGKAVTFASRDHHDLAHNPGTDAKTRADTWFVQQFSALIKKLKDIPEAPGSMLDNTVILLANHMSNGARHSYDNLPWILAGRGGGYFKTGRYLRAQAHTPTNQLFVGLAEAMGVPQPNQSFGNIEYPGLLPGLSA